MSQLACYENLCTVSGHVLSQGLKVACIEAVEHVLEAVCV